MKTPGEIRAASVTSLADRWGSGGDDVGGDVWYDLTAVEISRFDISRGHSVRWAPERPNTPQQQHC
uniref:Uncharacterized protein n=1 Tax=Setaria digitata TaxID=48799 RepID=A0A915Q3L2_9BILA